MHLDSLWHIQTTRLIPPKMSMSHSIQRRRTRDGTALHLPAALHPSTSPFPSLWILTPPRGWREKEKGQGRSGGAGTVSPARRVLSQSGWVFKHGLCGGDAVGTPPGPTAAPAICSVHAGSQPSKHPQPGPPRGATGGTVEMQSVATQVTFRALADRLHTRPSLPRTPHFSRPRVQL